MAFTPSSQLRYYLASKESGKVLGVNQNQLGEPLRLVDYKRNDQCQLFRFDPGDGFYWMKFRDIDKYLAVNAASRDDNASIIMWKWEPNAHHLMFEFIHSAYGYYRIRARHSGKFLEIVRDSSGTEKVVQNIPRDTDNQLFFPVLSPDQDPSSHPVFWSQETDWQRMFYMTLISKIPTVGEGLAFVVGFFWKDRDHMTDIWEMMKNYVDVRIRQLIKEYEIQSLKDKLLGNLQLLAEIRFDPTKKGHRIQNALDGMIRDTPSFTNKSVEILPLLMFYGTILIMLRKMMYENWSELFDGTDTDAAKLNRLAALGSSVNLFSEAIKKSKKEYLDWRMKKIDLKILDGGEWSRIHVRDTYDDQVQEFLGYRYSGGSFEPLERAQFAETQRKKIARIRFKLEIDELTRPSRLWENAFTSLPAQMLTMRKTMGMYGGYVLMASTFSMKENETLDRIDFFEKSGKLCGLEFFLKGKSYGVLGDPSDQKDSITLGANEYFNSAFGFARNEISALWVTTNKGRKAGAGGYGNNVDFFRADLPDRLSARLHGIDAVYNEYLKPKGVMQLSFRWEYEDYPEKLWPEDA